MTTRPEQPEPYLRGCVFPPVADVAYPRANPVHAEHLPVDVWASARVPVGVRIEFVGDAHTVRIGYRTATANLGYRGEGAGCTFAAYRSGQKVGEVEAVLGDGVAELELYGDPDRPTVVYLPEGMRPTVLWIDGVGGTLAPAPHQPRWIAYGDAATAGWLASSPAMAWPAVVARKLGLDLVNLGYSGSARAESYSAVAVADTPAEVISISYGVNNWTKIPHTPGLMAEEIRAFIRLVRTGHPTAPVVVVSPTVRPDAEDTPNRLGATLGDLRFAMEEVVRNLQTAGDEHLHLVPGATVLAASDLEDGLYPGDEGHKRLAAAVSKHLAPLMDQLRQDVLARRQEELLAESPGLQLVVPEADEPAGPAAEPQVDEAEVPPIVPAAETDPLVAAQVLAESGAPAEAVPAPPADPVPAPEVAEVAPAVEVTGAAPPAPAEPAPAEILPAVSAEGVAVATAAVVDPGQALLDGLLAEAVVGVDEPATAAAEAGPAPAAAAPPTESAAPAPAAQAGPATVAGPQPGAAPAATGPVPVPKVPAPTPVSAGGPPPPTPVSTGGPPPPAVAAQYVQALALLDERNSRV